MACVWLVSLAMLLALTGTLTSQQAGKAYMDDFQGLRPRIPIDSVSETRLRLPGVYYRLGLCTDRRLDSFTNE